METAYKVEESNRISGIGITKDVLSSRAGLSVLSEFVEKSNISQHLAFLNPVKKSAKGTSDQSIYKQIILKMMEGTSNRISYFNHLKSDPSYAQTCGIASSDAISSKTVTRFMESMPKCSSKKFRRFLLHMFKKDLKDKKPPHVILDIDTVVYDNDTALKREGCSPTYKKVKGFQPLMVKWNNMVVWAEFREGKLHSNHGTTVHHVLELLIKLIRNVLGKEISIITTLDSGFFDQKIFSYLEKKEVSYICSGKMFKDVVANIANVPEENFKEFTSPNPDGVWEYAEFMDRRGTWNTARRAVFTRRTRTKDGQFEMLGLESIYYTNLTWNCEDIITTAHGRGEAELLHRKLKDFAGEILPFKDFAQNEAWFFLILIAFDLFEMFKSATDSRLKIAGMYPTTFRRQFLDVAGKIVHHAGKIIVKTTAACYEKLQMLWDVQINFDYSYTG